MTAVAATIEVKPVDILRGAKDVLTSKGWTQGAMTDDSTGQSFCARGAMALAAGAEVHIDQWTDHDGEVQTEAWLSDDEFYSSGHPLHDAYQDAVSFADQASRAAAKVDPLMPDEYAPHCSLIGYNDLHGRTLDEVLAVFDRAIELAEQYEAQYDAES